MQLKNQTNKLYCFSKRDFDKFIVNLDINSNNNLFISICGTNEENQHYLIDNHSNVLNLNFDDCTLETELEMPISESQARELFVFLDSGEGCDIYIHCKAGQSRSQGVVRFLLDFYSERDYETRKDNPCITPNPEVVRLLKREYYKKYYEWEEE